MYCTFSLLFFANTSVLRNKQPLTDSTGSQSNTTLIYKHTLTTHSAFDTRKLSNNKITHLIVKNSTSCCEPVVFSSDVTLFSCCAPHARRGRGIALAHLFFKQTNNKKKEYTTNILVYNSQTECGDV